MKRFGLILIAMFFIPMMKADVATDKSMSKIVRDKDTYISADVRSTTEGDAYEKAKESIVGQMKKYLGYENQDDIPSDEDLAGMCRQLTSKIADNRYRVVLYAVKSELNQSGSKGVDVVAEDTASDSGVKSVLARLCQLTSRDEVVDELQLLGKRKEISGAAKFPISTANNFYIVVLNGDKVAAILHYVGSEYRDVMTSQIVNISEYSHCTGYWFTL